jgi:hypothetical protein
MSDEQAKEILEDVTQEIISDAIDVVIESLKQVEEQINDKYGDPGTRGQIWAVVSTADRDGTDSFEEDAISAVLVGEGEDLYDGLQNKQLAVANALVNGKIGTMVRAGAWMGPTGEVRPSEHPEKRSCVITATFTYNHVFFVIRFEDGTTDVNYLTEDEYNEGQAGGQQRLVDALLDFDYLPTALREHEPDEYLEIMESIQKVIEEDTE